MRGASCRSLLLATAISTSAALRLPVLTRRSVLLSSTAALLPAHQHADASDLAPIAFKAYKGNNKLVEQARAQPHSHQPPPAQALTT